MSAHKENKIVLLKNQLLRSQEGKLPKILFFIPPILWLVFVLILGNPFQHLLYASAKSGLKQAAGATAATANETTKMAAQLQEDLIFISQKKKGKNMFDLPKGKILNSGSSGANDSFLKRKAEQQLEKVARKANQAIYNDKNIVFTDSLNVVEKKDTIAKEDLAFDLDKFKNSGDDSTAATAAEKKDAEIEKTTQSYQTELSAYELGLVDYEDNYKNGKPKESIAKQVTPPSKKEKKKAEKLAFLANNFGSKNNFKRGNQNAATATEKRNTKVVSYTNSDNNDARQSLNIKKEASTLPDLSKYILAVIDQKIKIRTGDKIQIRVLEDTYWKKIWIPRNTILYGIVAVSANRVKIRIPSIQLMNQGKTDIIRTNLIAYDSDGIEGIYINGDFNQYTKDAIQEGLRSGANLGLNSQLGRYSLNLGRKANKAPKVFIPTGYMIKLYDSHNISNTATHQSSLPNTILNNNNDYNYNN